MLDRYYHLFAFLLLFCFSSSLYAQNKYWVFFDHKQESIESDDRISLQKDKQPTIYDYRINCSYIEILQRFPLTILQQSRWLNAVSIEIQDKSSLESVKELPFVTHVQLVKSLQITRSVEVDKSKQATTIDTYRRQLDMLRLDRLHAAGYTGKGVTIAVFDNGFIGVNQLEGFGHLFEENRIIATKDFVEGDEDVYECGDDFHCKHGTWVFSILAAKMPGQLFGSAPDAHYILLRTENDASETHQEEDNWVAAAEYADSLGADIFTTSLGYFTFDEGEGDYTPANMDGNTAIITRAADIAAEKGIIVVNSAGNQGNLGISAPADGDGVIAVGSVNQEEEYSAFSSVGPSADGRVKPDVTAMGERTFFLDIDGVVSRGNGTSFSCPLVSGLMACLKQVNPYANRDELYNILLRSSDRYANPNEEFGYGIPSGEVAYHALTGGFLLHYLDSERLDGRNVVVYPNPSSSPIFITIENVIQEFNAKIEIIDPLGKGGYRIERKVNLEYNVFRIDLHQEIQIVPGIYVLNIYDMDHSSRFYSQRIMIR